jgi:Spy/CpxP family protein refolding chaperone
MRSVLKNKVLVSIIGILLLANIAMLVFLVSGMRKPDRDHAENKKPMHSTVFLLENKIGFDKQQINQFNELKEEHYKKLNPLFEDLRVTKNNFFVLVKDPVSDSDVDSLASIIGQKQKSLDLQVFRTIQEVRSLCTPEQQAKFDSLLPKIAYKMVGHIRKGTPKEDDLKKTH